MWAQLAMFVITLIVAIATRPRAPKTKPFTLQDFDIPTAEEDRSIPVVFGTVTVTGPNVVWHGDFSPETKTKDGVKTRKYYMGMHFIICYGPVDSLLKIMVDTSDIYTTPVTANSTIQLNKPDIFGGEKGEGGIAGPVDIMMGGAGQPSNGYLASANAQNNANQPAYYGVLGAVYKHGLVSANSSYLKPWSFKVKRIVQGWSTGTAWYAAKAEVLDENSLPSGDMNAVHILYECITNTTWGGMRRSASLMDNASWEAAADTCYTEGMGLSAIWVREGPVEEFIMAVLDHIGAAIGQDMSTGKITITLIRDDYDHNALPMLDETKIIDVPTFERPGMGEMVNQIVMSFLDQATNKVVPIADQNLASIQAQGFIVSESIDRTMFSRIDVAGRALTRELKSRSTPLAKGTLICNRQYWKTIIPGAVFKMQWAKRNIGSIIIRITEVDYGDIENGRLTVQFVEDVFGLADANYLNVQSSLYDEENLSEPVAASTAAAYEPPYWMIRQVLGPIYGPVLPPGPAWVATVAARTTNYEIDYDVWDRKAAEDYRLSYRSAIFNDTALLSAVCAQDASSLSLSASGNTLRADMTFPLTAILGTNANHGELIALTGATVVDGVVTEVACIRALWDTTPTVHAAGQRLWVLSGIPWQFGNEYFAGDVLNAKILPRTEAGILPIASAAALTVTPVYRYSRPYPPGGININGVAFPAIAAAGFTVTWVHRNRLSELVNAQWSPSDPPEPGTQYACEIYDDATDTLLDSLYNTEDMTWTPTLTAPAGTRLRLEIWSGIGIYLFSWQKQVRIFDYISTSGSTGTLPDVNVVDGVIPPTETALPSGSESWGYSCSDEGTTAVTTGVKVTDRSPYAFKILEVRASLITPQTSGAVFTIDVKVAGVSIFSTLLTFDNTEDTTATATTAAVIVGGFKDMARDAKFTVEVTAVGDGTAKGLKVHIIGNRIA